MFNAFLSALVIATSAVGPVFAFALLTIGFWQIAEGVRLAIAARRRK